MGQKNAMAPCNKKDPKRRTIHGLAAALLLIEHDVVRMGRIALVCSRARD